MTLRETFGLNKPTVEPTKSEVTKPNRGEVITGKIYHLGDNYGFIESDRIPQTRIFFHWQNLVHGTLHFSQLKKGTELEFVAVEEKNYKTGVLEWRAQRVKVINNG